MLFEGAFPGYFVISLGQALSPAIGTFQLKQEKEVQLMIFGLLPCYHVTLLPCYPNVKKGVGVLLIGFILSFRASLEAIFK